METSGLALLTRLAAEKNEPGEWVISSGMTRGILADSFQDLKKE